MAGNLIQIFFALTVIALACFLTYKLTLPVALKIIDLCFESSSFRMGIIIFLALFFCGVGLFQLKEYLELSNPGLERFFSSLFFVQAFLYF